MDRARGLTRLIAGLTPPVAQGTHLQSPRLSQENQQ